MTGVEPWWISACAPCSSTSPPRGSPSQSCLGFAHSRASCARVPGGGSRAGSSSLEPRSSRFGSFTVRSWSRTRRGGSYHSRILCPVSESRTVRFPGRSGEGSDLQPLRDLRLARRQGQSVQEVPGGQLAVYGASFQLPDRYSAQVRYRTQEFHCRGVVCDGSQSLRIRGHP